MPIGCRVLLLEGGPAARIRTAALEGAGYLVDHAGMGEERARFQRAPPCVILLDLSRREQAGARALAAARAAHILGIPVVAIGSSGSAIPGVQTKLSVACDGEDLAAAVEVACFGHGHWQAPADPVGG